MSTDWFYWSVTLERLIAHQHSNSTVAIAVDSFWPEISFISFGGAFSGIRQIEFGALRALRAPVHAPTRLHR